MASIGCLHHRSTTLSPPPPCSLTMRKTRTTAPRCAAADSTTPKPAASGGTPANYWAAFARQDVRLRNGMAIEVVQCTPSSSDDPAAAAETTKTPLVFLHGSYHAAWCWEKFQGYFAARGRESFALSLVGQGESDVRTDAKVAGTVESHARDVAQVVATVTETSGRQPVLVAHSFGGLIAMKALQATGDPGVAGLALLSSVPPSGNDGIVKRFLASQPIWALRLSWGFITSDFQRNLDFCRKTFFDPNMSNHDAKLYQSKIKSSTKQPLFDLRQLKQDLPLQKTESQVPVLVLAGDADRIVDSVGVVETASFYDTTPIFLPNVAHDAMLDTQWQLVADKILSWLESDVDDVGTAAGDDK